MTNSVCLNELLNSAHPIAIGTQRAITQQGIQALLGQIEKSDELTEQLPRIDRQLIDSCIAKIDHCLSEQMDEILHHPEFQQLESSWRNLHFLVKQSHSQDNVKIDCINLSQAELSEDLSDSPELAQSSYYQWLYNQEYAQFGGEPYAATIANYQFSQGASDISLLRQVAAISATAHAPFIAAASPRFFGLKSFADLSHIKALNALLDNPAYASWHSFRETEEARYIGLTLPAFMQRAPYQPEQHRCRQFAYREKIQTVENYLWGNASFALASRLVDSFARYRWCPNIIGPESGGTVQEMPLHFFDTMGEIEMQISTETLIPDRMEKELAEQGFIPLCFRKGSDQATFFSANSAQKPKRYSQSESGNHDSLNSRLGTQLPYLFVISRIAHYLKVLQREQLGSWKEAEDLQRELNNWIKQYVANQDHAPAEIRSRKPLREAQITVSDTANEPGWYQIQIQIRPHFKYMGSDITLSLTGRLEAPEAIT